jgi:glycosyltransferase involved in cell wall biosynthesis
MKIIAFNSVNYGSTGNIMFSILSCAREKGYITSAYYGIGTDSPDRNGVLLGNRVYNSLCSKLAHVTGILGGFSFFSTYSLLRHLDCETTPVFHLHNLHVSFINIPLLFRYIKKHDIHVVWTLHDCWAFTGHCAYFTLAKCEKWINGCHDCPNYREYPKSSFDNSKMMWFLKKRWFCGVKNMTIVTPSQWLANLVKASFLKEYPVKVIYNGIDLSVFKPSPSDFRGRYGITEDKCILLGVAFGWGRRKGLDVFIELANRLSSEYQIILVGTDDATDKVLPDRIISIHRTHDRQELAEIYSAADIFINPTREEVLGMVNIEALACGTPVISFNSGGSPECIDEKCGSIVPCDDIEAMESEIHRVFTTKPYTLDNCRARAESFDQNDRFQEYVALYESLKHE